jgi:hypothetical protein
MKSAQRCKKDLGRVEEPGRVEYAPPSDVAALIMLPCVGLTKGSARAKVICLAKGLYRQAERGSVSSTAPCGFAGPSARSD